MTEKIKNMDEKKYLGDYRKFVTGEVPEKESPSLDLVDVTWKELSVLNEIKNETLEVLIHILCLKWCMNEKEKFDEKRANETRIGSFDIYFNEDGNLHFDFATHFTFNAEQQDYVRQIMKTVKEEQKEKFSLELKKIENAEK